MIELAPLVSTLPLPLAQLLRRALNSHAPLELHHNAYYLAEAALKLASAARVGVWLDRALEPGHPITSRLEALAYPSLGQWRDLMRDIDRELAQRKDAADWPLGPSLGQLDRERPDWQEVAAFSAACVEAGAVSEDVGSTALSLGLLGFFDIVVSYRNRVIAHGGQRLSSYYEHMGELLVHALGDVLSCDALVGGQRLVYARLRLSQADEDPSLYWQALRGVASAPLGEGAQSALPRPDRTLAGRVCLLDRAGVIPLHPLVVYRIDDAGRESFGFLNRTIRRAVKTETHPDEVRRVDYLDYATGETVSGIDSRAALTALIGRLRGRSVTAEDLRAAQDASLSGAEPEAEPYAVPKGVAVGDFEILEEIGRGGMGVVYRAMQATLHRHVALKVMPPALAGDANMLRRFRREMSALARCDHPNVIKILTSGIDADRYFYAMELVDGADLARVSRVLSRWRRQGASLREGHLAAALAALAAEAADEHDASSERSGPVAPAPDDAPGRSLFVRMAELFAEAAIGLDHLHSRGILHRDIKPSNLLLTADARRVVVMDLGLARLHEASQTSAKSSVRILGTLRYAAPEQLVRRLADVDYRADIYGLGASLYELVTGRPMFDGDTESRLVQQILYETPTPPRALDRGIPPELAAIIEVATARDPSARYPSAAAMAADLRALADGRAVQAAAGWRLIPFARLARRRPAALGAVLIASAAAAIAAWMAWNGTQPRVRTCANVAYRWEAPVCIAEVPAGDRSARAVTWRLHERSGRVFRLDRVHGSGELAGDEQGEARWSFSWSDTGRISSVDVFDARAALQYRLVYSSDLTRAERRGPDDNPKTQEGTEVSVLRLDFDPQGFRRSVTFHNIYGYPVPDQQQSYGLRLEVDPKGRVVMLEHLGDSGRPAPTRAGVLREVLLYDQAGNETERRFRDATGQPSINAGGVSGYTTRFDAAGNPIERRWLDVHQELVANEDGIAGWDAVWDGKGNRVGETYLGPDGGPALHTDGHAGWSARYDERGRIAEKTFLDPSGKPCLTKSGYASWRARYDAAGMLIEEAYFGPGSEPIVGRAGCARKTMEYDGAGRITKELWFDAQGRPASTRLGHAGWRAEYDARGDEILRVLLGADGQPRVSIYGYAGWRVEHDERGTQVQITYLDASLQTTANVYGHARVRTLYNARGELTESAFFDQNDKPVSTIEGYALVRRRYDRRANFVEESYWGPEGRPVLHRKGYFAVRMRFDERGNKVQETWLGLDGAPVVTREGFASWRAVLDARGREVEVQYLDAAGEPVCTRQGFSRRTLRRDDHGNIVEEAFLAPDGKPATHPEGYAVRRFKHDRNGNKVEVSWWAADGTPALHSPGRAAQRLEYDATGNVVQETWWAADGRAAADGQGRAGRRFGYDERGRLNEVTSLDALGRVLGTERRLYDDKGRWTGSSFAGADGQVHPGAAGVSSVHFMMDDRGQRSGAACDGPKPVPQDACSALAASLRENPVEES
jgi:serine/threonine protein kinase